MRGLTRTALALAAGAVMSVPFVGAAQASTTAAPSDSAGAAEVFSATATSTDTFGLQYRGGRGNNQITVRLSGEHFLITDSVPIVAEEGCVLVNPGTKPYTVDCRAFSLAGAVRPFEVRGQIGNDTITNSTAVSMKADGGEGTDVINGGSGADDLKDLEGDDTLRGNLGNDTLSTATINTDNLRDTLDGGGGADVLRAGSGPDILLGGPGDNDRLDGGRGADILDGGTGVKDTVTYETRTGRVVASLDGSANDGELNELDTIRSVETLIGGNGPDVLVGSDSADRLVGSGGIDRLVGNKGADQIEGGAGDDFLFANSIVLDPNDGAVDTLNGGTGADFCRIGVTDPDVTLSCESTDTT